MLSAAKTRFETAQLSWALNAKDLDNFHDCW